jgi:hypothetical protein
VEGCSIVVEANEGSWEIEVDVEVAESVYELEEGVIVLLTYVYLSMMGVVGLGVHMNYLGGFIL